MVDGAAQCRSSSTSTTGRSSAGALQQIGHRVEEPGLLQRGLGPDGLGRVDGRDQAPDLATVFRHMGRHHLGVEAGQPRPQGLGEGLVGHRQVFLAATEEHQRTLVMGAAGQRRHQAGLAHPRFTGDEHRATLTRARRLERDAQHVELRRPGRPPAPPASPPAPPAETAPPAAASTRMVHAGTGSAMPLRMSSPTAS